MKRRARAGFPLLMAALLASASEAAATTQAEATLSRIQVEDQRVMTVAHRLASRGTALCSDGIAPLAGVRVHVRGQYAESLRADAERLFGLGDYPVVLAIAQDGPAYLAGLRQGDALLSLNEADLRIQTGAEGYPAVERFDAALERSLRGGPVRIRYQRGGETRSVVFSGQSGCASKVELVPGRRLNASADGRIVQISTAVLLEAADDAELAFILAHEMSHNILRHADQLDRTGRSARAIRQTEMEADRLGIRLMQAAGFDPHAAARFWSRFGRKTGAGIFSDGTHMRTAARVAFLRDEANLAIQSAQ